MNTLPSDCLVCGGRITYPLQWGFPGIVPKKLPYQRHLKALCYMTGSKRLEESQSSHPASPLVLTFRLPISARKQSALGHLQGQRAHYLWGRLFCQLASGFSVLSEIWGPCGQWLWQRTQSQALFQTHCIFFRREQLDISWCFDCH